MSQRAEELLKRLVEHHAQMSPELDAILKTGAPIYYRILADARAYLARERGPVAESDSVSFYKRDDGTWYFVSGYNRNPEDPTDHKVRIEVPRHLYAPEVLEGEVAEGDARTALEPEDKEAPSGD